MLSVRTEKKLLGEFVELFKELPCLWDSTHTLYTNREAREKAYELLLEKYRIVYDNATIDNVKRRLENMRCCFRREHRKVIAARLDGGPEYNPTLWYYKALLFLENVGDFSKYKTVKPKNEDDDEDDEESDDPPPTPVKRKKLSTVFLSENVKSDNENEIETETEMPYSFQNDVGEPEIRIDSEGIDSEAASFGRTLGLQLDELQPTQRYIAEKLISEVIFYARMERLRPETCVNINGNSFN